MGCGSSAPKESKKASGAQESSAAPAAAKSSSPSSPPSSTTTKAAAPAAATGGDGAPSAPAAPSPVMSWAVLRNSHEAIRHALASLADTASPPFASVWAEYVRFIRVHSEIEDHAVFPYLNSIQAGSCSSLAGEHERDVDLARAVDDAFAAERVAEAERLTRVSAYREFMLAHLAAEEKIMMPLTQRSGATPAERSMAFFVNVLAVTHAVQDFDWSLGWVIGLLSRKGSTEQPPLVATRVWAVGLVHACPPGLWGRLKPTLRDACAAEIWEAIPELEGPGLLPLDAAQEAEAFRAGAETLQRNIQAHRKDRELARARVAEMERRTAALSAAPKGHAWSLVRLIGEAVRQSLATAPSPPDLTLHDGHLAFLTAHVLPALEPFAEVPMDFKRDMDRAREARDQALWEQFSAATAAMLKKVESAVSSTVAGTGDTLQDRNKVFAGVLAASGRAGMDLLGLAIKVLSHKDGNEQLVDDFLKGARAAFSEESQWVAARDGALKENCRPEMWVD